MGRADLKNDIKENLDGIFQIKNRDSIAVASI
jgi:hypothetical protein